jgi:hypothetical protein
VMTRKSLGNSGEYKVTIIETQTGTAEIYDESNNFIESRDWKLVRIVKGIVDFIDDPAKRTLQTN